MYHVTLFIFLPDLHRWVFRRQVYLLTYPILHTMKCIFVYRSILILRIADGRKYSTRLLQTPSYLSTQALLTSHQLLLFNPRQEEQLWTSRSRLGQMLQSFPLIGLIRLSKSLWGACAAIRQYVTQKQWLMCIESLAWCVLQWSTPRLCLTIGHHLPNTVRTGEPSSELSVGWRHIWRSHETNVFLYVQFAPLPRCCALLSYFTHVHSLALSGVCVSCSPLTSSSHLIDIDVVWICLRH